MKLTGPNEKTTSFCTIIVVRALPKPCAHEGFSWPPSTAKKPVMRLAFHHPRLCFGLRVIDAVYYRLHQRHLHHGDLCTHTASRLQQHPRRARHAAPYPYPHRRRGPDRDRSTPNHLIQSLPTAPTSFPSGFGGLRCSCGGFAPQPKTTSRHGSAS